MYHEIEPNNTSAAPEYVLCNVMAVVGRSLSKSVIV